MWPDRAKSLFVDAPLFFPSVVGSLCCQYKLWSEGVERCMIGIFDPALQKTREIFSDSRCTQGRGTLQLRCFWPTYTSLWHSPCFFAIQRIHASAIQHIHALYLANNITFVIRRPLIILTIESSSSSSEITVKCPNYGPRPFVTYNHGQK